MPCKLSILIGGDAGTRTPDPLHAKQVLYQLSYIPTGRRPEDCTCRAGHLSKQMRKAPLMSRSIARGWSRCSRRRTPAQRGAARRWLRQTAATARRSTTPRRAFATTTGTRRATHRPSCCSAMARIVRRDLRSLNEEHDILDSVCSSDAQRAPLFARNRGDVGLGARARVRRRGAG